MKWLENPTWANVNKLGIHYADGVVRGSETIDGELEEFIQNAGKPSLEFHNEEERVAAYNEFYDQVLEGNSVLVD